MSEKTITLEEAIKEISLLPSLIYKALPQPHDQVSGAYCEGRIFSVNQCLHILSQIKQQPMATKLTREDIRFEWEELKRENIYKIRLWGIVIMTVHKSPVDFLWVADGSWSQFPQWGLPRMAGFPDVDLAKEYCEEQIVNAVNSILK